MTARVRWGSPPLLSLKGRECYDRPKDHLLRCWLPYGIWCCGDGREVLFNRFYEPVWQRSPGGETSRADPYEWVHWRRQDYFYDDGNLPWRTPATLGRCLRILKAFGASWEPIAHLAAVKCAETEPP